MIGRKAQPCWVDPDGTQHPLRGKGHEEFAYDFLWKEKLGEHMSQKPRTDGIPGSKGKSGEVAAAEAHKEMGGNPADPRHSEELLGRGWVKAHDDGCGMVIRASEMSGIGVSLWCLSSTFANRETVVFLVGSGGSSVSAGLCGKALLGSPESVLRRLSELFSGKPGNIFEHWISPTYGIRYFEKHNC